mgnify:CR=1 FL=1
MEVSPLPENKINVYEKMLQEDMYYKGHLILSYTVKFPYFTGKSHHLTLNKINAYYRTRANMYVKSEVLELYRLAMVEYEYAVANNYPVRPFDVITVYEVTYNRNCVLSLYFDRYEYTGGAHGITIRSSDTWNIAKSSPVRIASLFPFVDEVDEYVVDNIIEQIDQLAMTEIEVFPYFEDYETLVKEQYDPNNFYLSHKGIIIYFQQYEIAPYSSGIPEFLIPYSMGGACRPRYC